jgi:microcystin-dependent protein
MSSPFVAEIRIFACNFAPTGWATCDGQLLPISQNTALFSLLGTTYGGDGKSTFALPDFDGSAAMNQGQGAGLSQRFLGETGGEQTVTLLTSEMPNHNHALQANSQVGNRRPVSGNALARSTGANMYLPSGTITQMAFQAVTIQGSSNPHNNMQPYLALVYCIAMQGVFPQRP